MTRQGKLLLPLIISSLYSIATLVLLLPITAVYLMYMVLAPVAGYPLPAILIPLCFAMGFFAVWRLYVRQRRAPTQAWPIWIKIGCGLMVLASILFLVAHSMGALYLDSVVIYYYGAAPMLYVAIAASYARLPAHLLPAARPATRVSLGSALVFLLAFVWLAATALIAMLSMAGALAMHGFETIADLFTPINLLTWILLTLLASPGLLLLALARRLRSPGVENLA